MIYDNTDYSKLIKFSKDGLIIGSYTDIRNMLLTRYKQIYGQDIDLSTGTADGQFIEMLAMMLNNVLLTVKQMYTGLDPNYAQGKMLDIIASFSNVVRRPATRSQTYVTVQNISNDPVNLSSIEFLDDNGTIWTWSGTMTSFQPESVSNSAVTLPVQCSEIGAIKAPAGSITKTAQYLPFSITQPNDAIVGSEIESDESLRARRNASLSSYGMTTLEALKSALLGISGIKDVYIYNNSSDNAVTAKDGQSVSAHSVYICISYDNILRPNETTIGQTIYNKMTPGIHTTTYSASTAGQGTAKSYQYNTGLDVVQTVYWKLCTALAPTISIKLTTLPNYDTSTELLIEDKLINFCNTLPIGTDLNPTELFVQTMYADPKFKGLSTFIVTEVKVDNSTSTYTNKLSYYDYRNSNITITYNV